MRFVHNGMKKNQAAVIYMQRTIHMYTDLKIIGRLFALFIVEIPCDKLRESSHDLHLRFLRNQKK